MRMPIKLIPDEIIQKYKLKDIEEDDMVYLKTAKGMYGLPQAGKIVNDLLIKHMRTAGYHIASLPQDYGAMSGGLSLSRGNRTVSHCHGPKRVQIHVARHGLENLHTPTTET